jgi:hypothetical protein
MIEFTLNDEAIDYYLDGVAEEDTPDNLRLLEDDYIRITEDNDFRILE